MKNNIPTITEISTETAAKFAKTTTDEKKAIAIGDKNAHINDNPIIRNGLFTVWEYPICALISNNTINDRKNFPIAMI